MFHILIRPFSFSISLQVLFLIFQTWCWFCCCCSCSQGGRCTFLLMKRIAWIFHSVWMKSLWTIVTSIVSVFQIYCQILRLAAEEERVFTSREFSAYGSPLKMVTSFRYLGRAILAAEDDWPAVVRNLAWARVVWKRITRILSREGA